MYLYHIVIIFFWLYLFDVGFEKNVFIFTVCRFSPVLISVIWKELLNLFSHLLSPFCLTNTCFQGLRQYEFFLEFTFIVFLAFLFLKFSLLLFDYLHFFYVDQSIHRVKKFVWWIFRDFMEQPVYWYVNLF